jgi:fluoride exporter
MIASLGLVALGSAAGGMARYGVSGFVARRFGEVFPWGTLIVNISGCLIIGTMAGLVAQRGLLPGNAVTRELGMIGFCGGYTTFSSFSLQTLNLARDGEWPRALFNILGSTGLCLAAVWAGAALDALVSGG